MATNAVYKVYNGSEWVEYYFKTSAGQVGTSASRKFVTSSVKVNGVAFTLSSSTESATVTIAAKHINWDDSDNPYSTTSNYLREESTVFEAIKALDIACKNAYDNVPSGIVTTSNFSNNYPDLNAIESLSGTSGILKKTAANTWTLDTGVIASLASLANNQTGLVKLTNGTASIDTTSYVAQSRTINSKALSSNVTLYATDIQLTSSDSTTVKAKIDALASTAAGLSLSFAIECTGSFESTDINASFNSTNDSIEITALGASGKSTIGLVDGSTKNISDLKIGDTIFVKETNIPDRWLGSIVSGSSNTKIFTFYKLETYNMTWGAISGKPTTLAGYGITDCSLNSSTGAITIGSVTKTPIYDISGKADNNHASSSTTYGVGTSSNYGHVKLVSGDLNGKSASDGMAASQSHTHSQYLTSHQSLSGYATETWVTNKGYVVCKAGTSFSGTPRSGDIWIDTNN